MNNSKKFTYDQSPPPPKRRSTQSSFEGLTPEQEWAKIVDAAERKKIQNRNAQRKYRHNLKRRVEALERHQSLGGLTTPSKSPEQATTPKATEQQQNTGSVSQSQEIVCTTKSPSMSPRDQQHEPLTLMTSISDCLTPTRDSPEWLCTSQPLTHQTINPTHLNPSPEMQMSQLDAHNLMMSQNTLDEYIQHNSSLIEEMKMVALGQGLGGGSSGESICSEDLELVYPSPASSLSSLVRRPHFKYLPQSQPQQPQHQHILEPPSDRTTLHLAAMSGHIQIVAMLLEKGIDINARDSKGYTALHLAVEAGHFAVVKMLCERGADYFARI